MPVRSDPEGYELDALRQAGAVLEARHVLEVGCGEGRLTARYASGAASVVAIDPELDPALLNAADPAWGGHVEFLRLPLEALDLGGRRFDIVLFAWSL